MQGTELHVIGDKNGNFITAHARNSEAEDTGFSFVHCKVDGTGTKGAYLGRAWQARPRVIFSYTSMSSVVNPEGWSNNFHPERDQYVYLIHFLFIIILRSCLLCVLRYENDNLVWLII